MKTFVVKSEQEVIDQLTLEIEKCAKQALSDEGVFRVGLSGGSVLNYLSAAIPRINTDLRQWKFFFCDERFVDEVDAHSTYGAYKTLLIPQTLLKVEQFVNINTEITLEECAKDYEEKILKEFQLEYGTVPEFDLLLLGMGPDGHTCSLFPEHTLLQEKERLIAPIADSPKAPPKRITMTLPLINNARCCIFAMCGESKADMVKRVFVDKEALPAAMVAPKYGDLICIFDEAAGKHVSLVNNKI